MLTLYHNGQQIPIDNTEYYLRELASGYDEIIFSLSIYDPVYAILAEEEQITDRAGQRYLVKQIDAGTEYAKVICILDLDDWKAAMWLDFDSDTATVAQTVQMVLPDGWSIIDRSGVLISRTIRGNFTALEVCEECRDVFHVYFRWDNVAHTITILSQEIGEPVGAFASRQLNLKEIQYKGKSNDFATRLYPYGKEDEDTGKPLSIKGLLIDGEPYPYEYVENRAYADKVISVYWSDERYTVQENLYEDAVNKLAQLAVPDRSYECAIVDLQATNPELYRNMDFGLFVTATLIDDIKGTAVNYQVVERRIYPYHPEQNEVIFDKSPQRITTAVTRIAEVVENPNSSFNQIINEKVINATNWMTSADGYVVARKDTNGTWKELLFLDTPDLATARNILRINTNGIGFSHNGLNGPYTNAWTIDGNLVADFITTGTLTASLIKAGILSDLAGLNYWNLETGEMKVRGDVELAAQNVVASIANQYIFAWFVVEGLVWSQLPAYVVKHRDSSNRVRAMFAQSWHDDTYQEFNDVTMYAGAQFNRLSVLAPNTTDLDTSGRPAVGYVVRELLSTAGYSKFGGNLGTGNSAYPEFTETLGANYSVEVGVKGFGTGSFIRKAFSLTDNQISIVVASSPELSLLIRSDYQRINGQQISFSSSSSRRYKHSIEPIKETDLDPHHLLKLEVVQFVYNDDHKPQYPDMAGKTIPGFIAEDVEEVYPAAVIHDAEGQVESWDERRIIPGMLALIQEQEKRIAQLERLVAKLMEGADIGNREFTD